MHVRVNGVRLFFDVEGPKFIPDGKQMRERPTLILLHGGPGFDHTSYKPEFTRLAEVAQVVYLDHRGQGRSDKGEPADWTLDQWADDVRGFCEALEIEKPIVMGNSFGGMVAMVYAARHPEHPGKLIFSSTSAQQNVERIVSRFEERGGVEVAALARAFWEKPCVETLGPYAKSAFPVYTRSGNLGDPDSSARTIWAMDVLFHFAAGENASMNLLPGLARVACPTLLLAGDLDPVCPIEDALEIAKAVPEQHLRFERFEDCGHGVFRDDPERGFGVIREFILEGEGRGAGGPA